MQITSPDNPGLRVKVLTFYCPFQPNEVPNFQIFKLTKLIATTTKGELGGT